MPITLQTSADPFYSQRVALDGVPFRLEFRYVQRMDLWSLTIATDGGELVAVGIPLVAGARLLSGVSSDLRPKGELLIVSVDDRDPGLYDLAPNGASSLVYYSEAEAAE